MLATTKNGLYYTPDYTIANPQFYNIQTMPFNGSTSWQITSDPFNSDRIYVCTHGAGVWRADLSVITAAGAVQGVGARTLSNSEAMLNWTITGPTGTGYIIEKSTDQTTWTTAGTVSDWRETSYMVTGLAANTQYYFRLRTTNTSGNSVPS